MLTARIHPLVGLDNVWAMREKTDNTYFQAIRGFRDDL
ncbi:hypothetical protein FAIPA1_10391 [Frankia sp. AiPs1]